MTVHTVGLIQARISRANFAFPMPDGRDPDEWDSRTASKLSPSWWLAHIFPSNRRRSDKPSLTVRLQTAIMKPIDPSVAEVAPPPPQTLEELEVSAKAATDKERLIGLLAAPLAAIIGILIGAALISNDPPAHLSDGTVNKLHVSVGLYQEAMVALLVLAVIMLATAYFRKRLYLAIVLVLYGLTVFNLHYWGFGLPYLMAGSWMLVHVYRTQKAVRVASGDTSRYGPTFSRKGSGYAGRPRANRRYTPPTSR